MRSIVRSIRGRSPAHARMGEAPDDLREIDRAAAEITVHGARYPEHLLRLVGR